MSMDDTAIKLGVFDQTCFYKGFKEFANQSIEKVYAVKTCL